MCKKKRVSHTLCFIGVFFSMSVTLRMSRRPTAHIPLTQQLYSLVAYIYYHIRLRLSIIFCIFLKNFFPGTTMPFPFCLRLYARSYSGYDYIYVLLWLRYRSALATITIPIRSYCHSCSRSAYDTIAVPVLAHILMDFTYI